MCDSSGWHSPHGDRRQSGTCVGLCLSKARHFQNSNGLYCLCFCGLNLSSVGLVPDVFIICYGVLIILVLWFKKCDIKTSSLSLILLTRLALDWKKALLDDLQLSAKRRKNVTCWKTQDRRARHVKFTTVLLATQRAPPVRMLPAGYKQSPRRDEGFHWNAIRSLHHWSEHCNIHQSQPIWRWREKDELQLELLKDLLLEITSER